MGSLDVKNVPRNIAVPGGLLVAGAAAGAAWRAYRGVVWKFSLHKALCIAGSSAAARRCMGPTEVRQDIPCC